MTRDFISTIIPATKNNNLTINSLFSSQGNLPYKLTRSNRPLTRNDLILSNPINGLDLDSTSSIYQIFDRPEGQILVCDICSQEFNDPKSIKQHKREAHRYQCDQCASNYTGNEHYFIHGRYLDLYGACYFACDVLKFHFSERTHLSNIRETHYFHCNINGCKRPYQDAIRNGNKFMPKTHRHQPYL